MGEAAGPAGVHGAGAADEIGQFVGDGGRPEAEEAADEVDFGAEGRRAAEAQGDSAGADDLDGGDVAKRAFGAMMDMQKIDIAKIEAAIRGQAVDA